MTKSYNIVDAWNKTLIPAIESGDLSANEQLTFVYIIAALNRNMWEPVKVNPAIIAGATGKDKRTIKTAVDALVAKGFITISEGEIDIANRTTRASRKPKGIPARGDTEINASVDAGGDSARDADTTEAGAEYTRRIFKQD